MAHRRYLKILKKIFSNLTISLIFAFAGVLIAIIGSIFPNIMTIGLGLLLSVVGFILTVNNIDESFKNIQEEIKKSIYPFKFTINELDKAIYKLVSHLLKWHKYGEYPIFNNLKITIRLIKKETERYNSSTTIEWFEFEIEEEWYLAFQASQVTVDFNKLLPRILVCDVDAASKFSKKRLLSIDLSLFYPIPNQLWKKYKTFLKNKKFLDEVKFTISIIEKRNLGPPHVKRLKDIEYTEIRDINEIEKELLKLTPEFNKQDFSENFMYLLTPKDTEPINIGNSSDFEWKVTCKCRYKLPVKEMEKEILNIYEYYFDKICSYVEIIFKINKEIKDIVLEEPLIYLVSMIRPDIACEPTKCTVKIVDVFPGDTVVFRWNWQKERSLQSVF